MPRKVPNSGKKRRERNKLKRAVKRGDAPSPPPFKPDRPRRARKGLNAVAQHSATRDAATVASRRLQSSFVKLPPHFLQITKELSAALPLTRPIAPDLAILPDVDTPSTSADSSQLTCPTRPKWRYDMSKKEVEANEEGVFKKWLARTEASLQAWCNIDDVDEPSSASIAQEASDESQIAPSMPHAPSSFERNLEVWRQLWRVTEISEIVLILLDSRCPTLHMPSALSAYLSSTPSASRVSTVLVLTKVDISGPERAAAWTTYLNTLYPGMRVVQVESYTEKYPGAESSSNARKYEPHLPSAFRQTLVHTLRDAHAELLQPPPAITSDPKKLAQWKPRVKTQVDWDALLNAHGGRVGTVLGGAAAPKPSQDSPDELGSEERTEEDDLEPEVLTIGVIGQPNVGKSSLLNALFGTQKVRASRTPGKTKHFQTLFWTPEVRLVDCPGLVIPNYVPMETQVLNGILPISRVSAIPLCIHHAARLLPLEKVLGLAHPSLNAPPVEYTRTWRDGMRPRDPTERAQTVVWTAMDILTAYATKKGWYTAMAGRPDVNRAGNAILQMLADGRIPWGFWPPGTDLDTITAHERGGEADVERDAGDYAGAGIWIPHARDGQDDLDESERDEPDPERAPASDDTEEEAEAASSDECSEEEDELEEGEDGSGSDRSPGGRIRQRPLSGTMGKFGALVLDDAVSEDDEEGSEATESE